MKVLTLERFWQVVRTYQVSKYHYQAEIDWAGRTHYANGDSEHEAKLGLLEYLCDEVGMTII